MIDKLFTNCGTNILSDFSEFISTTICTETETENCSAKEIIQTKLTDGICECTCRQDPRSSVKSRGMTLILNVENYNRKS